MKGVDRVNKAVDAVKKAFMRIQYNSPVILTYALVCFVVVVVNGLTSNWTLFNLFSVYKSSFSDPLAYIRVFGHTLGHASFDHYFSNIMIILMIGPMLEEKYGSRNIAIMMAVTAFVTGIAHMLFFSTALTGASGVVFMLILLSSFVNTGESRIPLTLILSLLVFLGRELMSSMSGPANISYFTHVLGGLCGAGFGFVLNKRGSKKIPKAEKAVESDKSKETPTVDDNDIIDMTRKG